MISSRRQAESRNIALDQIDEFNSFEDDAYDAIYQDQVTSMRNHPHFQDPEEERECNKRLIVMIFLVVVVCMSLLAGGPGHYVKGQEGNKKNDDYTRYGSNSIYKSNLRPYGSELRDNPIEQNTLPPYGSELKDKIDDKGDISDENHDNKEEDLSSVEDENAEKDGGEKHDKGGFLDKFFGSKDEAPIGGEKNEGDLTNDMISDEDSTQAKEETNKDGSEAGVKKDGGFFNNFFGTKDENDENFQDSEEKEEEETDDTIRIKGDQWQPPSASDNSSGPDEKKQIGENQYSDSFTEKVDAGTDDGKEGSKENSSGGKDAKTVEEDGGVKYGNFFGEDADNGDEKFEIENSEKDQGIQGNEVELNENADQNYANQDDEHNGDEINENDDQNYANQDDEHSGDEINENDDQNYVNQDDEHSGDEIPNNMNEEKSQQSKEETVTSETIGEKEKVVSYPDSSNPLYPYKPKKNKDKSAFGETKQEKDTNTVTSPTALDGLDDLDESNSFETELDGQLTQEMPQETQSSFNKPENTHLFTSPPKKHDENVMKSKEDDQESKEVYPSVEKESADTSEVAPSQPSSSTETPFKYKFSDIDKPYVPGIDVPFFWYIPRTGGTSCETMLTRCHGMVAAGNKGAVGGGIEKDHLEVMEPFPNEFYVNVELRTPEGIQRAVDMDVIGSGLVDVVFASRLYQVRDIFRPPKNQGRCFLLMRHPIERAVSLFYYLKDANADFRTMTIDEYAVSARAESDWMTRSLARKLHGVALDDQDLSDAMDFLRTKCLIGLTSKYSESYKRFEQYFGLGLRNDINCENNIMGELARRAKSYPHVQPGSETWKAIEQRNRFDMKLFEYAVQLFEEQDRMTF